LEVKLICLVDQGMSREAALEVIAFGGGVENMQGAIAAKRRELEAREREAIQAAYDASPEGRAKAARAALKARAETEELVEGGRELLRQQGLDPAGLTPDEVLHLAGIRRMPELFSQAERDEATEALARTWHTLDAATRAMKASELGFSSEAMDRYAEVLAEAGVVPSHGGSDDATGGEGEGGDGDA
jgi:hypothetical protein